MNRRKIDPQGGVAENTPGTPCTPRNTYTLTLASLPLQPVDETVRLRRLLKIVLRSLGFRCLDIRRTAGGER